MTITIQALSLVGKAEQVQVRNTTLRGTNMASNGSCFMVTWTFLKNHLLEVGPTQNQETMTLRMINIVDLLYFIMCEDLHE